MSGRKPDYYVNAMVKSTDVKGRVGAAWIDPRGHISIVLDPFVVLTQQGRDLVVTLFPHDGSSKWREPPEAE